MRSYLFLHFEHYRFCFYTPSLYWISKTFPDNSSATLHKPLRILRTVSKNTFIPSLLHFCRTTHTNRTLLRKHLCNLEILYLSKMSQCLFLRNMFLGLKLLSTRTLRWQNSIYSHLKSNNTVSSILILFSYFVVM